jgi:hypothetical protein
LGAIVGPPYAGAVMQMLGVGAFPFTLLAPLAALGLALLASGRRS